MPAVPEAVPGLHPRLAAPLRLTPTHRITYLHHAARQVFVGSDAVEIRGSSSPESLYLTLTIVQSIQSYMFL